MDVANKFGRNKVTSAGFIKFSMNKEQEIYAECYGESGSLNLKSKPDLDNKVAKIILNL